MTDEALESDHFNHAANGKVGIPKNTAERILYTT